MSSSLLRQSGRLARLSAAQAPRASRTGVWARGGPALSARLARRGYATDPKKEAEEAAKKAPSKAAPGTENLYKDPKSALQRNAEQGKDGGEEAPLEEGYVRLSPQEEEAVQDMLQTLKKGMPQSQVGTIEEAFEQIKRRGVPKEVKEIMEKVRNGEPMTLSTAARLTRITANMARKDAQRQINEEAAKKAEGGAGGKPPGDEETKGKQEDGPKKPETPSPRMDMINTVTAAIVMYFTYRLIQPAEQSREITWQEFRTSFLDKGLVERLTVVNNTRVRVDLNTEAAQRIYPDSPVGGPNYHCNFTIGSVDAFERKLDEAQRELQIPSTERIPVGYTTETPVLQLLMSFGPTLLITGLLLYGMRRVSGGAGGGGGRSGIFGMGKSRAKQFNHETDIKVKFRDVAGMDEAKLEIMEFVSFLKTPERYARLGAKIPRGAILSGPPGTGKTLLAKATAGESAVPFYSVSGSEFVEMFVGVGPSRVRDLFAEARKNTPCIVFIDEIDAIGKARGKAGGFGGNDERESTLNQILTEMDGFNTSEQVVVLAGTNRADVLDKALMRPGRFDRHINIDRPTMDGRKQIFAVHLKKIVTHEDIEYLCGRLSALTPGFSGADIGNCCNEAALIAARTSADSVKMIHFEQAIERVVGGLEKKSLILNPEEKRVIAYHEAGHAICGWYFKYAHPLLKVSIIPRGQGALGYAQYLPNSDQYLMNVHQIMDQMAMTLGGRVSEQLHFPTVTTGASDDFNKVTRMATAMVTQWGMSSAVGPLHFEDDQNKVTKPYAESTAQTIDAEVRRIVDAAYEQCRVLLDSRRKELGLVAEELLRKEVLARDDMVRLLGQRPFEDNQSFEKYFGGKEGKGTLPPPPPRAPEQTDTPPEEPSATA